MHSRSIWEGRDTDFRNRWSSEDVVKAYYTHEEIVLPIIKKHQEQFPSPPSPTSSSPSISRTASVKTQPTSLSPSPTPTIRVPEQRLNPYGPSYGARASIRPEDITKKRAPPTPSSPGFGSGDMFGALMSSSYKNKGENRKDGKKEKVMPKVMMTPF